MPDVAERSSSRERWLLAAILGVGFLLRLTYLLEVARAPDFDAPQFEAQYHDYWARALVTGDWTAPAGVTDPEIPRRPYFRPPGYPFFLALIYRFTGAGYFWPRVLQMTMGLLSCLLLYRFARYGFGRAAALFSAALASVYWIFIFFEAEFMAVSLLVFLLLASLTLVARWRKGFTVARALGAGLLIGLATLVRPNAVVLLPALVLWIGFVTWRRDGGRSASATIAGHPHFRSDGWLKKFSCAAVIMALLAALSIAMIFVACRRAADCEIAHTGEK